MDKEPPWLGNSRGEIEYRQPSGGARVVAGWDLATILEEGLNPETRPHDSFNSGREVLEFVMGMERYSEINSFFYTEEDPHRICEEGFFQDIYCPRCVEEAVDAELDEEIDPVIDPVVVEDEKKSFKLDSEVKEVTSTWYQCGDHPEVYISVSESEYV